MGQFRPLFVYFRYFLDTISIIEKSVDGVLGIQTRGRRMVGADETTERPLPKKKVYNIDNRRYQRDQIGQFSECLGHKFPYKSSLNVW